ncbi:MAG: LIC_10190 family membrane protein [Acidobacteriota bacterium]
MLILILCWLYLLFVSMSIGGALLPSADTAGVDRADRAVMTIWIGLLMLALLLLVVALFAPLRADAVLASVGSAAVLLLIRRRNRMVLRAYGADALQCLRSGWAVGLLLTSATILVAAYCSQEVVFFDTGLYHYQMVAMLRDYGVLKGAALIHQRFGFTSSWFALAAPFPAQALGGFVLLVSLIHLLLLLRRIYRGISNPDQAQPKIADRFIVIAYLLSIPYLVVGNGLANSLSPDLPVALAIIVFGWWVLVSNDAGPLRQWSLVMALALFAVKLSTLPLVAIAVINYLIVRPISWRRWFSTGLLVLLLTAPVVTANILTSGCPLYPSGAGCQDQLPWAVGAVEAEKLRALSTNFARTEGRSAEVDQADGWFLNWMFDDFTGSLTNIAFLTLVGLVGAGGGLLMFIKVSRPVSIEPHHLLLIIVGVGGSAYILSLAPSLRFGIGYLVILPAIILARLDWRASILVPLIGGALILLTPFTELEYRKLRIVTLLLLSGAYVGQLLFLRRRRMFFYFALLVAALLSPWLSLSTARFHLHLPAQMRRPAPPQLESIAAGSVMINLTHDGPLGNQCWAAPAPCTPERPSKALRYLDPARGIRSGVGRLETQDRE